MFVVKVFAGDAYSGCRFVRLYNQDPQELTLISTLPFKFGKICAINVAMDDILENYRHLVARVDALCHGIEKALREHITCSEGCSTCCTSITLFPVETAALNIALDVMPAEEADNIRSYVSEHADDERCPLLHHQRCLLYAARPIICRTHGLPILYTENDQQRVDCCPLNMEQCESLPGSVVIDLDRLNSVLVAVNALFLSQTDNPAELPERLSIAEALTGGVFVSNR